MKKAKTTSALSSSWYPGYVSYIMWSPAQRTDKNPGLKYFTFLSLYQNGEEM